MLKLIKNNPDIPINKIYPYRIENNWEQVIDCSREELEELYKQIKEELYPKPKLVDFSLACEEDNTATCIHKWECRHTYLDCLKFSREDFHPQK